MRILRLLLVLALLLGALPVRAGGDEEVGILRSPATLKVVGWRGEWEFQGARAVLGRLGLSCRVLEPADLEAGTWQGRLLVLPDVRLMAPSTAEAVRRYVQGGGRILATYQTSYRDEENRPLQPAGFRLADLFGVDFHRWAGSFPPGMELEPGPELGPGPMPLGKTEAMLVRARPGARVLATWSGPDPSPAVVETEAGLYAGASLLAPENSDSPEVARFLGRLLERLLPGWKAPSPIPSAPGLRPRIPVGEAFSTGREVAVGLPALAGEALVGSPGGLRWDGGASREGVRIRRIATLGRPPAVALYDLRGRLLLRSEKPVRLHSAGFFELTRLNPNGTYRWTAWRGDLRVDPGVAALGLVNLLPLEAYLPGVVPNEMPPWFPPQALRAMAVVARTFTLSHLDRHRADGFDLCTTVHCHVYEGLASEHPASGAAVRETRDLVLRSEGAPADTTYHAVCGGEGEAPEAIWTGSASRPYLPGAPDTPEPPPPGTDLSREEDLRTFLDHPPKAWCDGAGRFRWEETWTLDDLGRKVEEALPRILGRDVPPLGRLRAVGVRERTRHGRVAVLVLEGEWNTVEVRGDSVRWLTSGGRIGAGGLQSSLFYVDQAEGRVRFRGGGWGHGVGFCQEGAAGRARGGQQFPEILQHYYPGTRLEVEAGEGGTPSR